MVDGWLLVQVILSLFVPATTSTRSLFSKLLQCQRATTVLAKKHAHSRPHPEKNLNIFECSNNFKVPSNKMIGWTKCFNKCSTKSSNQPYVPYETDSKNAKVRWRAYHEIHWVRELIWRTRCDIAYTCYSLRSFLYDTVDFFLQLWPTLFN